MALTKITTSVVAVNSLTAANIADNSIDATKIANNQILARHIAAGSLSDAVAGISSSADATAITIDSSENVTFAGNIKAFSTFVIEEDGSGVYLGKTDNATLRFITNNTERLRITNDGKVGIGTSSPSSQFVVAASNGGKGIETQVTTHASNNQFILAYDRANSAYLNMELSALNFGIATNNGTNRFKILSNGNVGINCTAPEEKLVVDGGFKIANTNNRLYFGTEGGTSHRALEGNTSGSLLQVGESYTDIALQGNVGIGETNPGAPLHITSNTPIISFDESDTSQEYKIGSYGGTFALYDETDSAFRFVVDGSGKFGIGTTAPDGKLHVYQSDASITPDADADDFIIEGNSATGITIGSSASSVGSIRFADSGSPRAGMIYYNHVGNEMRFYTTATERFRIDASGDVQIGGVSHQALSGSARELTIGTTGNTANDGGGISFTHNGALGSYVLGQKGSMTIAHYTDGSPILFRTNDGGSQGERMRISSTGKVGIGGAFTAANLLEIQGGGYDQIRIGSNHTDNTNKTAGIVSTMYTNNSVSFMQGFFQNGNNSVYYGSADGAHRGLQNHYFYVNSNYNAVSNHALAMRINSSGVVTKPLHPSFDAQTPSNSSGVMVYPSSNVNINVGSCYNATNGRFTAPVAGTYLFYTNFIKNNQTTTTGRRRFNKNGSALYSGRHIRLGAEGGNNYDWGSISVLVTLAANDYINVDQYAGNSYGNEYDSFGGYLIG